ncbi:hypothetical protein D9M73_147360 [compost metagenome]
MTAQERQLLGGFDAFSHDLDFQVVGHGDHRGGDFHVVLVVRDFVDKASIDLDDVDGEFFQVTERRVTGAEVVHGQGQAQALELVELQVGVFGSLQQQAFGQLQLQQMRRQGFFLEDVGNGGHQVRVGKLLGRQVDRHLQVAQAGGGQRFAHAAGLAGDPFANRNDQAGFFRDTDELVRADHAFFRVIPAQ